MLGLGLGLGLGRRLRAGGHDSDVAAFIALNAAGAISGPTAAALDRFVRTGKSIGWWSKLIEVWPMVGNSLTAALVKLKTRSGGATSLVNQNFVSGDYSQASGIGANSNSTKYLQTGIIPSDLSLDSRNISFGGSILPGGTRANWYPLGDNPAVETALVLDQTQPQIAGAGNMQTPQFDAEARVMTFGPASYYGSHVGVPNSIFSSAASLVSITTELTVHHSVRSSVARFWSGKSGLMFVGGALSLAECNSLSKAIYDFENAVRSPGWASTKWSFFGDSITAGSGATAYPSCWVALLSAAKSVRAVNFGRASSQLRQTSGVFAGGIDRYLNVTGVGPTKIVVMYGTNDMNNNDANTNGGTTETADLQAKLTTILNYYVAAVGASNVVCCSPPYNTVSNTTKQAKYRDSVSAAAVAAGCVFVDIYQTFIDNTPASLLADTLHPNNTGHALIATTLGAVM